MKLIKHVGNFIYGSISFQKGLGAIHSLSHPIGAIYNTHHGLTNAVFMPYVLIRNREAIENKIVDLSRYLNLSNPSFNSFLDWILDLRKSLSIPHTLKELIDDDSHFEKMSVIPFPVSMPEPPPTAITPS